MAPQLGWKRLKDMRGREEFQLTVLQPALNSACSYWNFGMAGINSAESGASQKWNPVMFCVPVALKDWGEGWSI